MMSSTVNVTGSPPQMRDLITGTIKRRINKIKLKIPEMQNMHAYKVQGTLLRFKLKSVILASKTTKCTNCTTKVTTG